MQRRDFLRVGAGIVGAGVIAPTGVGASGAGVRVSGATADNVDATVSSEAMPDSYAPLGRLELVAAYETVVSEDGRIAYVATGDGFATVDLSDPTDPTLLASRSGFLADHEDGPLRRIRDVAVEGDDLLVVGPAHGRGVSAAVHVDVSDPAAPERVGIHRTDYPIHNADLADGYAYLTANDGDRNPLTVVDLGHEEGPQEVARWSVVNRNPDWEEVHPALRVVHDVHVAADVAYLAYWDAGTHALDVADPESPEHLGEVGPYDPDDLADVTDDAIREQRRTPPGNHHAALPNEDGDLLAVNVESWAAESDGEQLGGPGGVRLYDVTDWSAPDHLATVDPPESPAPTIDGVWTTSHNFDLRDDRLYTAWYEGGVKLHDVSDPTAPEELVWWRDPANASFWTAQAGVPGEFFIASSTGHRPAEPALYIFPDEPGTQADAPPMQDAVDDGENAAETPTPPPSTDTLRSNPTADGSDTTDDTADSVEDGADTPVDGADATEEETSTSTPGFGIGTGVAAIGGAAWWLRRRVADEP